MRKNKRLVLFRPSLKGGNSTEMEVVRHRHHFLFLMVNMVLFISFLETFAVLLLLKIQIWRALNSPGRQYGFLFKWTRDIHPKKFLPILIDILLERRTADDVDGRRMPC